jgi:hypothetical protein
MISSGRSHGITFPSPSPKPSWGQDLLDIRDRSRIARLFLAGKVSHWETVSLDGPSTFRRPIGSGLDRHHRIGFVGGRRRSFSLQLPPDRRPFAMSTSSASFCHSSAILSQFALSAALRACCERCRQSSALWRYRSAEPIISSPCLVISPLPSAQALQDHVYSRWPFVCLWPRRSVSNSRRSKLCPFSSRVTSKVARHPRASMLGLRGEGLASLLLGLQSELDQAADGFGAARLSVLL